MSQQWHYSQDGAQYGPVDESEIIRLIQEGELAPGTPVLKVGSNDWQPARNHACFQVEIYPKKKREPTQPVAQDSFDDVKFYEQVAAGGTKVKSSNLSGPTIHFTLLTTASISSLKV